MACILHSKSLCIKACIKCMYLSLQVGRGEGGSVYFGDPSPGRTRPVAGCPLLGPPPVRASGGNTRQDNADVVLKLFNFLGFILIRFLLFSSYFFSTVFVFLHRLYNSILLYAKLGHEAAIQEVARVWLLCPVTAGLGSYRTVSELYLLCVLLPLGRTDEARQLVLGEVGSSAFSEDQRQLALEVVTAKETECQDTPVGSRLSPSPGVPVPTSPPGG